MSRVVPRSPDRSPLPRIRPLQPPQWEEPSALAAHLLPAAALSGYGAFDGYGTSGRRVTKTVVVESSFGPVKTPYWLLVTAKRLLVEFQVEKESNSGHRRAQGNPNAAVPASVPVRRPNRAPPIGGAKQPPMAYIGAQPTMRCQTPAPLPPGEGGRSHGLCRQASSQTHAYGALAPVAFARRLQARSCGGGAAHQGR